MYSRVIAFFWGIFLALNCAFSSADISPSNGLMVTIDNNRNMKFCEVLEISAAPVVYSSVPFGSCDDRIFSDLEFSDLIQIPSRFATRDVTVFRTGIPTLGIKHLVSKTNPDNEMEFIHIGLSEITSKPSAYSEFSVKVDVNYQWNAKETIFVLKNIATKKEYIMASSHGGCDVPCLEKTLVENITLPSADWVLTESIADTNIIVANKVATFVKDNLNNNYLLMK